MNIVKRIRRYFSLRSEVEAWYASATEQYKVQRKDARTIPAPPAGYERFPHAVRLQQSLTRELCRIKQLERQLTDEAYEKLRRARLAETDELQYRELCQIFPSEVARLSYMDQQWFKMRMRDLMITDVNRLIDEARQCNHLAFRRVQAMIARDDPEDTASYIANTGLPFPVPPDWDDVKARFSENSV